MKTESEKYMMQVSSDDTKYFIPVSGKEVVPEKLFINALAHYKGLPFCPERFEVTITKMER